MIENATNIHELAATLNRLRIIEPSAIIDYDSLPKFDSKNKKWLESPLDCPTGLKWKDIVYSYDKKNIMLFMSAYGELFTDPSWQNGKNNITGIELFCVLNENRFVSLMNAQHITHDNETAEYEWSSYAEKIYTATMKNLLEYLKFATMKNLLEYLKLKTPEPL